MTDDPGDASAREGGAGSVPRAPERRRATVLYADVTGSTALSEGRDPEDLYPIMGGCLKLLEQVAREHGAGLVKSRGDGVLAVFGLPEDIEAPAHAAVEAAIEMRRRVAAFAREQGLARPLELHTGVDTGPMVAGDVSTAANPEVDVVGDAVTLAAQLSGRAPPGSIYVGEDTARATAEAFHYAAPRRLKRRGKSGSVAAYEVLSARGATQRPAAALAAEGAPRGPERRRATVLYADVIGSTALSEGRDPEELYAIMGGCLKLLERVASEHGAGLVKSRGDGVLAVFGLPTAIEAPAHAAVNAAIEMRDRVAAFTREHRFTTPLELHTGVNTGVMVAGDVSTAANPEVDVVGDAVNVAARLSGQAPPGAIYVGEDTYRATAEEFRYAPPRRLTLRGKSSSVTTYEVLSARTSMQRPGAAALTAGALPLVGRGGELSVLEQRVRELASGRGGAASLVGEAGLGKSRLVAELEAFAAEKGVGWHEGRGLPVGGRLRFHLFADLLRRWWSLDNVDSEEPAESRLESRLRALVPSRCDEILPFLASLLGIPLSSSRAEQARSVQGEALERVIQMSVRLVLSETARREPQVLVFEDLHWADRASLELLGSLLPLATRTPILFLWVTRPDPEGSHEALGKIADEHRIPHVVLELAPLSTEDCERMLAELLPERTLPRDARRRIVEKSAGNPFFLEEVAFSLLDEGGLVVGRDGLESTDRVLDLGVPDRVQDVILTRVDRLAAGPRALLQACAVIGTRFSREILSEIVPEPELLEDDLAALLDAGFVARVGERGDTATLSFRHPMIRDATYESLLRARRRQLHDAVGRAVERRGPDDTPGYFALLAFHATLAEDVARAEEFLFRAGEEAAQVAATSEALHFFQEASRAFLARPESADDPVKRALLEKNVALSFFYRGLFPEALDHFNRWLELLGEPVARGPVRTAARLLAGTAVIVREAFRPPVRRPPATERQREIIAMMFDRARAQTTAAPGRFLIDTVENFRQLGGVDPASVPGAGGMVASGGLGIFGFSGISFPLSRRLLDVAAPLVDPNDPRELFLFQSMRYYHHAFEGDWDPRHEIEPDLIERAVSQGQLWDVATYLGVDARKKAHQGRFDDAASAIERLATIEELYAYDLACSNRQAASAMLWIERGELSAAAGETERYRHDHDEELLKLLALSLQAKVAALRGDPAGAREALDEARAIVRRTRLLPPFYRSAFARSELLVDVAALEAARREGGGAMLRAARRAARASARRAARIASRVAWERAEIARLVARHHWLCGRRTRALEWWSRSLSAARALGARPELARTCLEVARWVPDDASVEATLGTDAARLRAEGEEIVADLGLPRDESGALQEGTA